MNTTTQTETSIVIDSDTYVAQGAFGAHHSREWADEFKALGGESCMVHPTWRCGTTGPVVHAVGTPEAVAFVENTVSA